MAEDVKEEAVEEETKGDAPDTQQAQKGKVFTQEEVNRLIAKEKSSWKRTADKDKEGWGTTETELRESISARDEVIQQQVELLMKDLELDEITKELLAEKDALQQFKTLVKIMEKKGKSELPKTPRGEKPVKEFETKFRANI